MHIRSFLFYYLIGLFPLGYIVVFLGMLIEGDIVLFSASFLAFQGFFNFWGILVVAFLGAVIGDFLWYALGYYATHHLPRVAHWTEKLTHHFDKHIIEHPLRTIFISKFTYGLNRATLMRSAMLKIPLREVLESDLPAIVLWIVVVSSLGYFSGLSYEHIKHYVKFVEFALLISLVVFVMLERLISVGSKRRL